MKNKGWIIAAVVLVMLIGGTIWAFSSRRDPKLARLDKLSDEFVSNISNPDRFKITNEKERKAEEDRMRQQMREFSEEVNKLPEDEREAYMKEKQPEMEKAMIEMIEKFVDDFFAKSKKEQNQELDQIVKQMQEQMKDPAYAQRMANAGGGGFGFMGGGGGAAGGGRQSFGRDSNGNNAAVDQGQAMLDKTSPEFRGKMEQFQRMMLERMTFPQAK